MKTRRILSTILAIVFVLSTLTFSTAVVSAEGNVVYLDSANGSDGNSGLAPNEAVQTITTAFNKAGDNGEVCIIGSYTLKSGNMPSSQGGEITISGYDSSSAIKSEASAGMIFKCPIRFKNISIDLGDSGRHLNTNGYRVTFDEGSAFKSGQIHVGGLSGTTTASEHFVIDGGINFTGTATIGGAYNTHQSNSVAGDVLVEVLDGTLSTLALRQDGYLDTHKHVYIGGNINVFVGKKGAIGAISNTGKYTIPRGSLNFIVEEGGKVNCDILASIASFNPKEYYWVTLAEGLNTEDGSVDFSSQAGHVVLNCDDGFVAEIQFADGTFDYAASGEYKLPANEKVTITQFRDDIAVADNTADITIEIATPGETVWPISVDNEEHFSVSAVVTDPAGAIPTVVDTYTKYTYDVTLKANDGYVFPGVFTLTINSFGEYSKDNVRGYRIENFTKTSDAITFTYVADYTAAPEGTHKVSYDGGSNDAYILGTLPDVTYLSEGTTFYVADADVFGLLGYSYTKYTDGTDEYLPGDEYTVGTNDVVLTPVWEKDTVYTVIINPNSSDGDTAPKTIFENIANNYVTIPENPYAKTGYDFVEWSDGVNSYRPGEIFDIVDLYTLSGASDYTVNLYAQWVAKQNVGTIIYVDKATGSSDNTGATALEPIDTIKNAVRTLAEGADATIVVVNEADLLGDMGLMKDEDVENLGHITITGAEADSVLNINGYVLLGADTTIENIDVNAKADTYIVTNGYKAVIGPNLENVEGSSLLDIIDGHGYGGTVSGIDTTINAGVKLGSYYLGGLNLTDSANGIDGNVVLTVKGAEIETIDLSPKGNTQATIKGYIVANIYNSKIGTLKSSLKHIANSNSSSVTMLFFNDGSMPDLDSTLIENLSARNKKVFIIDSGIGGVAESSKFPPSFVGKAIATASNPADTIYAYDLVNSEFKTVAAGADFGVSNINTGDGVNKIRYGTPIMASDLIEGTIGTPVGGAQTDTVRVTTNYAKAKVIIDSYTPDTEKTEGKFAYSTLYKANISIVPNSGYFFDDHFIVNGPSVIISGQAVEVELGNDGILRGTYYFEDETGTPPVLEEPITFALGGATGTAPTLATNGGYAEVLSTITLPTASTMSNVGYKFAGWREYVDGVKGDLYGQLESYSVPKLAKIEFVAEWVKRSSWEVPTVLILYDLTIYATDKGRNPEYKSTDKPIVVNKAFANLEHEINGTKGTKTTKFDYEEGVTVIASDGGANPIKINNWTLDQSNASIGEYKYLTIVYYYQTETANAAGTKGWLNFGNCKLEDGSTSKWIGKGIDSINTVVANKWAAVTFDFTQVVAEAGLDDSALYRQLQICPIGNKPCSELKGDTVYLKSMTFSKEAPIVD